MSKTCFKGLQLIEIAVHSEVEFKLFGTIFFKETQRTSATLTWLLADDKNSKNFLLNAVVVAVAFAVAVAVGHLQLILSYFLDDKLFLATNFSWRQTSFIESKEFALSLCCCCYYCCCSCSCCCCCPLKSCLSTAIFSKLGKILFIEFLSRVPPEGKSTTEDFNWFFWDFY